MRKPLNLNKTSLESFSFLIHGPYAVGKTNFLGDAMRVETVRGPVRFLNIAGEDGEMSLSSFQLGEVGDTIETPADLKEVLAEYSKLKLQLLCVDSLKALSRTIIEKVTGSKVPDKSDYPEIHWIMDGLIRMLKLAATRVICVCPSDKSVEQLSGDTYITPDLPGRQAAGSAGWFDFVAYLEADSIAPGKVTRKLIIKPNKKIITRQRLANAIVDDIPIPNGSGGYQNFLDTVTKAMEVKK